MALSKLLLLAALSAITVTVLAVDPVPTNVASPPQNFKYIGCYADPNGGGGPLGNSKGPKADDSIMTVEYCINQCSDEGPPRFYYGYIGLEYKHEVGAKHSIQLPS